MDKSNSEEGITRRDFLRKAATKMGMGAAAFAATTTNDYFLGSLVDAATGEDDTSASDSEQWRRDLSPLEKIHVSVAAPIIEEVIFRGVWARGFGLKEVLTGDGKWGMNRDEIVLGLGSSTLFMLGHTKIPYINEHPATRRFPAHYALNGFVLWYVQRKQGIVPNTLVHAIHNTAYVFWPRT